VEQYSFRSDDRKSFGSANRRVLTPLAVFVTLGLITPTSASADGIDIIWLLTRVGGPRVHPALLSAMIVGLMIVNYLLNFLVLGLPAARFLQIKAGIFKKDLATFTLLAQIADRGSAVGAFFLSFLIIGFTGLGGEQHLQAGALVGMFLNLIISGIAVGLLAVWYLRRRWGVARRKATSIAMWTALVTNPAWIMIIQWMFSI